MQMIKAKGMKNAWYEISSIRYHRNGVGGAGFFAVHFHFKDKDFDHDFIAVLEADTEEYGKCYVIMPSNPEQCMRGDNFEGDLRDIIKNTPKHIIFPGYPVPEPVKPEEELDRFAVIDY